MDIITPTHSNNVTTNTTVNALETAAQETTTIDMITVDQSDRNTTMVQTKLPINSIVKNSPFIITNHIQRHSTVNGSNDLDRFKKPPKSSSIMSKVKQYCDRNGDQSKQTTSNYNSYINKKNLANKTNDLLNLNGNTTFGMANATLTSKSNNIVGTNSSSVVAPSYSYGNSNLQDDDLLNIDVKSLVSNFCVCVEFSFVLNAHIFLILYDQGEVLGMKHAFLSIDFTLAFCSFKFKAKEMNGKFT